MSFSIGKTCLQASRLCCDSNTEIYKPQEQKCMRRKTRFQTPSNGTDKSHPMFYFYH